LVQAVIEFRVDTRSGVAPYRQLVQQVRQALTLGRLAVGDQLPTVKEVVAQVAINPNTVLKAYRELEHAGLVEGRPGIGTFVTSALPGPSVVAQKRLRTDLARWIARAREAGLDDDGIAALLETALYDAAQVDVA
jgi:GntR family transcriptional regulator